MEKLLLAAAAVLGEAVAQEVISRTVSSVLGKRKEKASQGDYVERLETAVRRMHCALESTARAPITEVSLLRERIELERGYMEAKGVLNKHKKRQASHQEQQQQGTQAITTHSSSGGSRQARRTTTTIFSIASPFIGPVKAETSSRRLSCDDVERFERLAGSAQDFLGMVSRCAWLGHRICFSGPLVSHLFQQETLTHKILEGSQEHSFRIWPVILAGRGVEAVLQYTYTDHERTDKSFDLKLQLRLSHSTDIVQVAIKSLQSLAAKFKLAGLLEPATGTLLQLASTQDVVSHAPRWCDPQWTSREEMYMMNTQSCRPNPVCCTAAYGCDDQSCAKASLIFQEEVISLGVRCYISGLELALPSPSDTTGATVFGDQPPLLRLSGLFVPHYITTLDSMLGGQKEGVAFDIVAGQYSEPIECSIQAAAEKAIEGLFRMNLKEFSKGSLPMNYGVFWYSKHGAAFFRVHDDVKNALFERGGWPTCWSPDTLILILGRLVLNTYSLLRSFKSLSRVLKSLLRSF